MKSIEKSETRAFWIIAVVSILAMLAVLLGLYKFQEKVSRLEEQYRGIKESMEKTDSIEKERLDVLERLLESRIKESLGRVSILSRDTDSGSCKRRLVANEGYFIK